VVRGIAQEGEEILGERWVVQKSREEQEHIALEAFLHQQLTHEPLHNRTGAGRIGERIAKRGQVFIAAVLKKGLEPPGRKISMVQKPGSKINGNIVNGRGQNHLGGILQELQGETGGAGHISYKAEGIICRIVSQELALPLKQLPQEIHIMYVRIPESTGQITNQGVMGQTQQLPQNVSLQIIHRTALADGMQDIQDAGIAWFRTMPVVIRILRHKEPQVRQGVQPLEGGAINVPFQVTA